MAASELAQIRQVVDSCPLLDNHGHNVVALDSSIPYVKFFTEAEGDALAEAVHAVAFKRNIREVAKFLGCSPSLEAVEASRKAQGVEAFARSFLEASNLAGVLIDDGLSLDAMYPLTWHAQFVPLVRRVLRLETTAQDILDKGPPGGSSSWTLDTFEEQFRAAIDPLPAGVVSFKSIACYRCGLRVDPAVRRPDAQAGLLESLEKAKGGKIRLTDERILNFIFVTGLEVATKHDIPLQVHTGFGDKDLDLLLANPLLLREVLEDPRFQTSKLVLLHTSYPYLGEATFLACVYSQVYLDYGLLFHKLPVRGMLEASRQLLDLAPLSKLLYSADAHGLPELYYLGAKWGREILARLLEEFLTEGDLTLNETLTAACDILHNNAVRLYKLDLPPVTPATLLVKAEGTKAAVPTNKTVPGVKSKMVLLMFVDTGGQRRCRVVPTSRFESVVVPHGVGIFCHQSGTTFSDAPAPGSGLDGVGEVRIIPDLTTRRTLPWFPEHEIVMVNAHLTPGIPWEYCPRSALIRLAATLEAEFGLVMRAGFESEFFLLKETSPKLVPVDQSPYCSTTAFNAQAPILQEMVDAMGALGIEAEQVHAEGGNGQYEFSYAHRAALEAADSVLLLREAVTAVAQRHGLRATFLPMVFRGDLASGSHIHLSITRNGKNVFGQEGAPHGMSSEGEAWLAGILEHLPAIMALTAPHPNSYVRLQPNMWAGAFQCWGRENREAALRTSCPPGVTAGAVSNVELKTADAMANPYLALAALLAAGMDGLRRHLAPPEPVGVNPAELPEGQVKRLPADLMQAVALFKEDSVLADALGPAICRCVVAVRTAEAEYYKDMSFEDAVKNLVFKF